MLRISATAFAAMIGHCYDGLPLEACGLLGGRAAPGAAGRATAPATTVDVFIPCRNADASSRTYAIGPDGWRKADEILPPLGLDVVGVAHSHTHTDPYPSPTDVAKADNPMLAGWHYVIVSLRDDAPMVRSYLIDGGNIVEEPIVVVDA
ncbi:MAG TPA: M67 family metallopeptidase [Acidimicrobiales bacterium]